eukprot:4226525-Ditylum_brightwellii.AAC.1
MLAVEKSCCRAKQGYAWSLKLVKAGKLVRYWKLWKSSIRNKLDFAHIQQLATLLEIEDIPFLSPVEIAKNLTAAQKALRVVQQNEASIQDTHLEEMAKARLKNSKGDLTAVIKNIKHCEEMKLSF